MLVPNIYIYTNGCFSASFDATSQPPTENSHLPSRQATGQGKLQHQVFRDVSTQAFREPLLSCSGGPGCLYPCFGFA